MKITIEELEKNFDFYLEKANDEDIYIVNNGEVISVMVSPSEMEKIKEFKRRLP